MRTIAAMNAACAGETMIEIFPDGGYHISVPAEQVCEVVDIPQEAIDAQIERWAGVLEYLKDR